MTSIISGKESFEELNRLLCEDSEGNDIELTKAAVVLFIDRFLGGEISGIELQRISEILEMNEKLVMEDDSDQVLISTALFQISTPEINGDLTGARMLRVRAELEN